MKKRMRSRKQRKEHYFHDEEENAQQDAEKEHYFHDEEENAQQDAEKGALLSR
jgi:hypothetical protein